MSLWIESWIIKKAIYNLCHTIYLTLPQIRKACKIAAILCETTIFLFCKKRKRKNLLIFARYCYMFDFPLKIHRR